MLASRIVSSPEEQKVVMESLFRMRAVESPPDDAGTRRVWHRGTRDAEVISLVDARGEIIQQDFRLFGDQARWRRGEGLRSSRHQDGEEAPAAAGAEEDAARLTRLSAALATYGGSDRFLQHLRERLSTDGPGQRASREASARPEVATEAPPPVRHGASMAVAAIFAAMLLVGLVVIAVWWG